MLITIIFISFVLSVFIAYLFTRVAKGKKPPVQIFPRDYKLAAENISFSTADGVKLSGWFIACPGSAKTIILMHGFDMNKGDILKRTHYLAGKYNLFYFDFRGFGESSGQSAISLEESKDIIAAVKYLKEAKPRQSKEIALYGLCMGAAVTAYYAAVYGGVKCLLLESAYYSFKNVAKRWAWSHVHVPYFPLVSSFLFFKERKIGKNIESFALKETASQITCPVLMIQGQLDKLAPARKAEKIYKLIKTRKELWVIPGARHTNCNEIGGKKYIQKIKTFFDKNL